VDEEPPGAAGAIPAEDETDGRFDCGHVHVPGQPLDEHGIGRQERA
jgi:hypothetical protein